VRSRIESDGGLYTGRGASTDIVVASAKAYMNALNRLILSRQQKAGLDSASEGASKSVPGAA